MSFYTLAIYFWSAVATFGVVAPFVALAVKSASDTIGKWLSSLDDDEPVVSSDHGPVSCP